MLKEHAKLFIWTHLNSLLFLIPNFIYYDDFVENLFLNYYCDLDIQRMEEKKLGIQG